MRIFEIDQGQHGETPTIITQILSRSTKQPIALLNFESATLNLPKSDGSQVPVTGSLVSQDLGKVSFTLTEANVLALKQSQNQTDYQSFEVEYVYNNGSTTAVVQYLNVLLVKGPLFTYV